MDPIKINFNKPDGLVPVIAQDSISKEILMLAYANEEAINLTLSTGYAHYYSRSRHKIWKKGESSGHTQKIDEIRIDCDEDSLIYKIQQKGGACHTGYYSCFYRSLDKKGLHINGKKIFNPQTVYKN
ncbi:MAG: phosphoribosyl-AMP cyclohydrolase [Spirochaetaceae bacterium]|nr:phosphoribosyl-AMP cyclohydrolase [Spirochaetaceae bacterium]